MGYPTWKTRRRSAFPVRISYKVNVLSEPVDANTDDSDKLNFNAEMVSVEVGKLRFITGVDLKEHE